MSNPSKEHARRPWLAEASRILGDYGSAFGALRGGDPTKSDALAVNKRISEAYARMYLSDPRVFKWAGMAAFASATVGGTMDLAQSRWRHLANPGDRSTWVSSDQVFWSLAAGNAAVFMDVYWQHLAYRDGGIAALEAAQLEARPLAAWKLIDEGRRTGDRALILEGNLHLLKYEQEEVLQKSVYDLDRALWRRTSDLVDSPIPGHDSEFHDYLAGGDFGDFGDRWFYVSNSLWTAWLEWDSKYLESIGLTSGHGRGSTSGVHYEKDVDSDGVPDMSVTARGADGEPGVTAVEDTTGDGIPDTDVPIADSGGRADDEPAFSDADDADDAADDADARDDDEPAFDEDDDHGGSDPDEDEPVFSFEDAPTEDGPAEDVDDVAPPGP